MSYTLAYKGAEIDEILGRAATGGALDTAIAAKQDALTFDDAPTSGSDNPVKSGGIYDAIQAGGAAALAAFATDSVSGDVVSFPDGASNIPVKAFTGSILPQQNLNGQSAPYPAGGGKNKVGKSDGNTGTLTRSGVTFKFEDDGSVTLSGTATAAIYPCLFDSTGATIASNSNWHGSSSRMPLTSGTYKFTATITGTGLTASSVTLAAYDGETQRLINGAAAANTIDGVNSVFLSIANGTAFSNCNIKWQLESGSTATAWTPYANICPISGWTGANITRAGVNLLESLENGSRLSDGTKTVSAIRLRSANYMPVSAGDTVMVQATTSASKTLQISCQAWTTNTDGSNTRLYDSGWQSIPFVYTIPSGGKYCTFVLRYSNESNIDKSEITSSSVFAGSTIVLTFGQTVYAGTLTALGGGLWQVQPTHAALTLNGSESWAAYASGNGYRMTVSGMSSGEAQIGWTDWLATVTNLNSLGVEFGRNDARIYAAQANTIPSVTDLASWQAYLGTHPLTILYPLATLPDPITITGEDLQTLLGANTVWTDVGSITGMTYRADTTLYIDKKLGA